MQAITNARNRFVEIEESSKPTSAAAPGVNLAEFLRKVERSKQQILKAIDDDLRKRVQFPVNLRDPKVSMTREGVRDLRALLDGLKNEVTNQVWKSDPLATAEGLLKRWDGYAPILNLLVTSNGTPRNWKISFIRPQQDTEDYKIISVYRYVQVIMSEASPFTELTHFDAGSTNLIGKGNVDRGIKIRFKTSYDAPDAAAVPPPVENRDWGLIRLIHANEKGRTEDGHGWRIRIPLTYPKLNMNGGAEFMIELESDEPLPKFEDWLKQ